MPVIMNYGREHVSTKLVFYGHKSWPIDALTLGHFSPLKSRNPVWDINGKQVYLPGASNLLIGNEWFREDDDEVKPLPYLVHKFQPCLENRINFILNVPPCRTGRIPDKWIGLLMEHKDKIYL